MLATLSFLTNFWHLMTYTHSGTSHLAIAPLIWAAIMAAGSALKAGTADKQKADARRRYETETARYSPWTGLVGKPVEDPSVINAALQGGLSGYSFGSGLDQSKIDAEDRVLNNRYKRAKLRELESSGWGDLTDNNFS